MALKRYAGIDPGKVHTAGVIIGIDSKRSRLEIDTCVVDGLKSSALADMAEFIASFPFTECTWIEDYRSRGNLRSDSDMIAAVRTLTTWIPNSVRINNMGVKKVITRNMLELLNLWSFKTPTHHQDLRSAARILLFGMAQSANEDLFELVDSMINQSWTTPHIDWNIRHIN